MPCPFPGMDPYIERPAIWPDFHDSVIAAIRGVLQPLLRPRYAAVTQDRLYVVEADRPVRPDVSVVRTSSRRKPARGRLYWRPMPPRFLNSGGTKSASRSFTLSSRPRKTAW